MNYTGIITKKFCNLIGYNYIKNIKLIKDQCQQNDCINKSEKLVCVP